MANHVSYVDIQERIARKLQIVADTEQVSAEDGEVIKGGMAAVEAALDGLGIGSFNFEDGLNEPMADPIVQMVAGYLVDEFQLPEPRRSQLKIEGMIGMPGRSVSERRLRALMDVPTAKLQVTVDVFHN